MTLKISVTLLLVFCLITVSKSQSLSSVEIAKKHIKSKADIWNLESSDYEGLMISSEATSDKGITYLYLQQTYQNIPVRNAMMTLILDKTGAVLSDAHSFTDHLDDKINTIKPSISSSQAVIAGAQHFGIRLKENPTLELRTENGNDKYQQPELSKSPIEVVLKYELVDDKLILVWNLSLDMANSADYWDLNIDATSGKLISKQNLTSYCAFHPNRFKNHDDCGITSDIDAHQHHYDLQTNMANPAKYNVFKLPVESPKHGSRTYVTDDQFPQASPYGWHDTNGVAGAEFTITKGNNVHAFEDKNDDNVTDGGEPDGGQDLSFDFPVDISLDPRKSNLAAVTNLFYITNMMHDVSYLLGFTEEFGNFQQKNYKGLPGENDFVQAQAFDGITLHEAKQDIVDGNPTKINNANFSTPNDGFSGRMQMFLWDNVGGSISIDAPEQIKGFVSQFGTAVFGKQIPKINDVPVTGSVALYKDGSANPTQGCTSSINPNEIKGKIAIIDRGGCDLSNKAFNAQKAGAIGVIICNVAGINGGNGEDLINMGNGQNSDFVTILAVFFRKSDCDKIRVILTEGKTVTVTFHERERQGAAYLDGSLDNGIIAHEYAHGISNRLTGGRLNSSCLTNDEQMGEGWSDFFSLVMTHKPGDKGPDARGIGTFADGQTITGSGIRRFPYSTDMKINPQTFSSIKGTSRPNTPCNGCHALGEIWTDMLWDMYWAMIEKYGFNADWNIQNSGNYKAVFLVMEGIKMQPCNPGFIDARNAILKADSIHFKQENNCLLWNVFARRGLGYFADGGNKNDRNDGSENFETLPTCIEKLKITKTITSSANPGDEVFVELKGINHVKEMQKNVVITDDLPNGMTYVAGSSVFTPVISGNTLTFELGNMDYEKEIKLSYKAKVSKENKSISQFYENFDKDIKWEIDKNNGNEIWLPNNDVYKSPLTSLHIINVPAESDAYITSEKYLIMGKNPALRFWHRYNTQNTIDGGIVEIIVNGSAPIPIKKEKFLRNGYNGPFSYNTLAIPSLDAFSGNSGGSWKNGNLSGPWIDSYIDLSEYIGKTVAFRFRFGSDGAVTATGDITGWFIDDFELLDLYKYTTAACISANAGSGEKTCTNPIQTIINPAESTNTIENNRQNMMELHLAPIPAEDYLVMTVTAPTPVQANVGIVTLDGKSVYEDVVHVAQQRSVFTMDIAHIPSGFYIIQVQAGPFISSSKLIIK
jgi:uncharacterized repeat protein (TIGR01451 family)